MHGQRRLQGVSIQPFAEDSPVRTPGYDATNDRDGFEEFVHAAGGLRRAHDCGGGGTGERLVAERLTELVRVVASATNGFEGPGNHWDITRPKAVLSVPQD